DCLQQQSGQRRGVGVVRSARGKQWYQRQQRHYHHVLEQQHRERGSRMRGAELAALSEQLQHERRS
ncbi:MAG: hypothetical protein ACAH24_22505, partial [Hyphomicrobiaceae bacterium]